MKVVDFFSERFIFLESPGTGKEEVIDHIITKMLENGLEIKDSERFKKEVIEREQLGATGIGDQVAIPHARTDLVSQIIIAFARTKHDIDFDALDGKKVRYIFLVAVPVKELKTYLTVLAMISRLVKDETVQDTLKNATHPAEIIGAIERFESLS